MLAQKLSLNLIEMPLFYVIYSKISKGQIKVYLMVMLDLKKVSLKLLQFTFWDLRMNVPELMTINHLLKHLLKNTDH